MNVTREPLWHMGSLFRWVATARDTNGAFSLAEIEVRAGCEPPPHRHTNEDESFYVLDGEMEFIVDGETTRARAGELAFLPRGRTHAFRVVTARTRALLHISPAGLEDAFLETSDRAPRAELPPPPAGPPPRELIERLLSIHGARGVRFELGGAR